LFTFFSKLFSKNQQKLVKLEIKTNKNNQIAWFLMSQQFDFRPNFLKFSKKENFLDKPKPSLITTNVK